MARQGLLYAQTRHALSREGGVELTNIRRFAWQGQPPDTALPRWTTLCALGIPLRGRRLCIPSSPKGTRTYPTRGYRLLAFARRALPAGDSASRASDKKTGPRVPWDRFNEGGMYLPALLLLHKLLSGRRYLLTSRRQDSGNGRGRPVPESPCSAPGKSGCR